MASEPPSTRHTPLDTSTRLKSAPPTSDAAIKTPAANMGTETNGTPAAQAIGQQYGNNDRVNDRLSVATGHDDTQTKETAGASTEQDPIPTTVKVEPDSGASVPENIPSIPSNKVSAEQANTLKQEADPAAASDSNPQQKPNSITLDNLQKLADETDLIKLEAGVDEILAILDKLQAPLSDSKQTKQLEWLANIINKLKQQSKKTRTVVAVVGETGAGKTSLINALLDEDRLLITSGWRACTAVICEISYNEADDPQKAYRAEVEFISQKDWDSETQILFRDLVEDNKISSMKSDSNTEAGIAYAKIKAVYPDLTDTMITQHTAKSLAKRESVAQVLGTTRRIYCRTASDLSSAIQKYLDSKEKSTKMGPKKEEDMAFWPLIKVVRIFCRSEALSSGLVIVDLPGVADSDPARSAVASKYMTECTAVWVAAPIKRATDNKVAKELMGKSSRLQMQLDGIYSNVTFICTMTDAIDFTEAIDAFDGDGQIQAANLREDEAQSLIKEKEDCLKRLEVQMQDSELSFNELERELKVWEGLSKKQQKGHTVYPPQVPSKRKRPARSQKSRRRRQVVDEDSDREEVEETPLTENDISAKLDDLETRYSAADTALEEMEKQQQALKEELSDLDKKRTDAAVDAARMCVYKRNDVVKKAIRVDFAAGVKEIDDYEAQDDENYDPSVEKRDYGVVASSLPVFTISAKAYQQISRPKKRETQVAGFRTLLDTEIPQLIEHALKLPEKGRIAARKTFLNEARKILNSLTIWCTAGDNDLGSAQMTSQEKTYEMQYLKIAMSNLRKELDLAIVVQKKELESILFKEIESKSNAAIAHAAKLIGGLVEKWPLKESDGGRAILFGTYRCTCRREGERTKAAKSFNFNEAILEPYLEKIATGWEQAFSRSIPSSLDKFVTKFTEILKEFHSMMAARPELQKCKKSSMRIFSQQLDIHSKSIEATIESMKADIQSEQRQASRMFPPEIKTEMKKVYHLCMVEKGPGCFLRIKAHMMNHINKQKSAMYKKASKRVLKALTDGFETNRQEMEDSTHIIVTGLQKDFEMILSNSEMLEASEVARDHIRGVLQGVDTRFGSILCAKPMEVDPAQPPVCEPQQLPEMSMADAEPAPGEAAENVAAEAVPSIEDVAMDTTQ